MTEEKRHCTECNYHLDDYADDETVCGACYNMLYESSEGEEQ